MSVQVKITNWSVQDTDEYPTYTPNEYAPRVTASSLVRPKFRCRYVAVVPIGGEGYELDLNLLVKNEVDKLTSVKLSSLCQLDDGRVFEHQVSVYCVIRNSFIVRREPIEYVETSTGYMIPRNYSVIDGDFEAFLKVQTELLNKLVP